MGQPSKEFAVPEERLTSDEIFEGRREECAIPSTGRMAQNPATAPTHLTRSDFKNFVKAMDRTGSAFKHLAENSLDSAKRKLKRGLLWVLRSSSSSETIVQQRTSG